MFSLPTAQEFPNRISGALIQKLGVSKLELFGFPALMRGLRNLFFFCLSRIVGKCATHISQCQAVPTERGRGGADLNVQSSLQRFSHLCLC